MTNTDTKKKREKIEGSMGVTKTKMNEALAARVISRVCVGCWSGHFRAVLSSPGRVSMEEEEEKEKEVKGTHLCWAWPARPCSVGREKPGLAPGHLLLAMEECVVGSLQCRRGGLSSVPWHGCLLKPGQFILLSL